MKRIYYIAFFSVIILSACKGKAKDSVVVADSTNKAIQDSALKYHDVVIDEKSSAFLVRLSVALKTELQIAGMAQHLAITPAVKDFAATLFDDLTAMNDSTNSLSTRKNVTLPTTLSKDHLDQIESFKKTLGLAADKFFISYVVKNHESMMEQFKNALLDTKDPEVRSLSDIDLLLFKKYLATAKSIQPTL